LTEGETLLFATRMIFFPNLVQENNICNILRTTMQISYLILNNLSGLINKWFARECLVMIQNIFLFVRMTPGLKDFVR